MILWPFMWLIAIEIRGVVWIDCLKIVYSNDALCKCCSECYGDIEWRRFWRKSTFVVSSTLMLSSIGMGWSWILPCFVGTRPTWLSRSTCATPQEPSSSSSAASSSADFLPCVSFWLWRYTLFIVLHFASRFTGMMFRGRGRINTETIPCQTAFPCGS